VARGHCFWDFLDEKGLRQLPLKLSLLILRTHLLYIKQGFCANHVFPQ
jgi:hypothetical protein